ncbi:MAG: hypothetical protein GF355_09425 [Candidatus Eisenbacteria bacterium]|nr:hypothetical protein [Candidatus Eisenbacteria bacterium]
MKPKMRIVLAFAVLGVAMVILVGQGFRGTVVYSMTVSDMLAQDETGRLQGLRVEGKVVEGTIDHRPAENYLHFSMTDGNATVPVTYRGIVPDTFGDMGEVTVEGSYEPGGEFTADFLMAKCPSKYEMDPEQLEARGGDHPSPYETN